MPNDRDIKFADDIYENHLNIFENRYELYQEGERRVFYQGFQSSETKERYAQINAALKDGFQEKMLEKALTVDLSGLSEENKTLINNMVNGITSNHGRGLVGIAFLQLTIKSIAPAQNIRLHKGSTTRGRFSWVEGISMRNLDSQYNTPFLREHGLLNLNNYGSFMTRSLAENYPYSSLYKAEIRGPVDDWIAIVDAIENETMQPELGLCYMISLLLNRSNRFQQLVEQACNLVERHREDGFKAIKSLLTGFFNNTDYSARAFEVTMHGLFQAMEELNHFGDNNVIPLSQMRSANKKHGNVGDIELAENDVIIESWDAKYGKPYLRDELDELYDKLLTHPDCQIAGFVVDSAVDMRQDIVNRRNEIQLETGTQIYLYTFAQWVNRVIEGLSDTEKNILGYHWLRAVVESFGQRRRNIAPIDEPCDAWINDLIIRLR